MFASVHQHRLFVLIALFLLCCFAKTPPTYPAHYSVHAFVELSSGINYTYVRHQSTVLNAVRLDQIAGDRTDEETLITISACGPEAPQVCVVHKQEERCRVERNVTDPISCPLRPFLQLGDTTFDGEEKINGVLANRWIIVDPGTSPLLYWTSVKGHVPLKYEMWTFGILTETEWYYDWTTQAPDPKLFRCPCE